ncbi:FAD-dependent oxidoreductase [Rhizobium sp. 0TCS1.26]|uniref:FAD-dependent oxidoreductase n=1 Tax=Rhizobium sp. 0TCS1.26 TaxID=3142623 RepID=UPI003D2A4325
MRVGNAAIIGAGMAGLTAALALSRRGIRCHVIEQAPQLVEAGAGLQISPNAARILGRLDVLPALERIWNEPEQIALASGTSLRPLASVPAGRFARERWGAPYGVLHRSSLQAALLDAVTSSPLCTLHLGQRLEMPSAGSLDSLIGTRPDVIVGADGVWSATRNGIRGAPRTRFSGNIAWRFTLASSHAPTFLSPTAVTALLGPSAHIVCYPLAETGGYNVVAIAAGSSPGHTWDAQASTGLTRLPLDMFRHWHPQIIEMLAGAPDARFWPLYEVGDGAWQNRRDTVLIGDAAHAMMPFAAQGAAMAIEDAWELAARITAGGDLGQALVDYEMIRKPRVAKVRARGSFNRFAYHLKGPLRLGRDLVLSLRPAAALAADLDWLYGYDPGV